MVLSSPTSTPHREVKKEDGVAEQLPQWPGVLSLEHCVAWTPCRRDHPNHLAVLHRDTTSRGGQVTFRVPVSRLQTVVTPDICSIESNLTGFSDRLKVHRVLGKDHLKRLRTSLFASLQDKLVTTFSRGMFSRLKLINLSSNFTDQVPEIRQGFLHPFLQGHFELHTVQYG